MTKLLLEIKHNNIKEVMWYPDDLKLRSCMTLFSLISDEKEITKYLNNDYYMGASESIEFGIVDKIILKST